jgi:methylamine dehydrogenase heavy chain
MPFATVRKPLIASTLLACSVAWATQPKSPPKQQPPELQAETLVESTLAGRNSARVYAADVAINHISDGRIRVFDAEKGRFLGMISTGFAGNFSFSPEKSELYVATTYLSRGSRGERIDVLEVHDTETLGFKYEVSLPPKRAQALNYRGLVSITGNGQFVLVQNATPATSITVVNLQTRQVASEVPTPGCWGTLPAAQGARFSMLCGDGKVATVTLNEQGQVQDRQLSEKMFDPDNDAWFHHAERLGDRYWFVSFLGQVTELNLGGPVAQRVAQTALVSAKDKKAGWRPGGYQNFAVDPKGQRLVAAMHSQGAEGSHKRPAEQLWVMDLASGKRLATYPGMGTASLTFSRHGQRLQALDGMTGAMNVWRVDAAGRLKHQVNVARAGAAALHIESHD